MLKEPRVDSPTGVLGNGLRIKAHYAFLQVTWGDFQVILLSLTAIPFLLSQLSKACVHFSEDP